MIYFIYSFPSLFAFAVGGLVGFVFFVFIAGCRHALACSSEHAVFYYYYYYYYYFVIVVIYSCAIHA